MSRPDDDDAARTRAEATLDVGLDGAADGDVRIEPLGERYRLLERLGEGGMGTVYRALDAALGVEVALKVVGASAGATGSSVSRGLRELRDEVLLAQRVTHENVCRTYDLEDVGGQWVVKMEYVRGETLADRIRRGTLPVDEALRVARQLVEGLAASHRSGVVHRDLKPANVLIEHGTGRVVVMDFGIARSAAVGGGRVAGTPRYMAPEQARGADVDGRADLYALGAVIYEMLAGDATFSGDVADLRERRPDVPAWLARVVVSLTDADPGRRPQDARAVAELLQGPRWTPEIRQLRAYTENSDRPALHPDGASMVYISDRERRGRFRVYVEPVDGGPSRAITPAGMGTRDALWSRDGRTVLVATYDRKLLRVDPASLATELLAEGVLGGDECAEGLLLLRPHDGAVAFVVRRADGTERVVHVSPTAVEAVRCDATGRRAVYSRMGATVAHPPADLWLVDLDTGDARALTHDGLENSRAVFHPDGRTVLFSSSRAGTLHLWEVGVEGGEPVAVTTGFGPDDSPSLSADGRLVLYHVDDGATQLFALVDGEARAISPGGRHDWTDPVASPDGRHVLAVVTPWGRPSRVHVVRLDDLEVLDLGEGTAATFSADGDVVVADGGVLTSRSLDGGRRPLAVVDGTIQRLAGGPDGIHLTVRREGAIEAWRVRNGACEREEGAMVLPAPAGGWRVVLSVGPNGYAGRLVPDGAPLDHSDGRDVPTRDGHLAWTADGSALFYATPDGVHRIDVRTGDDVRVANTAVREGFAVAPDGETLFVILTTPHIRRQLITNFGDRPRP